ncbi:MAG TPA: hypothetical protein VMU22_09270 [Rhizomicrobium sp.]|nr:hypothetical protein [Rhizomicrobium sp.]
MHEAELFICGAVLLGELALLVLAVLMSRAPLRAVPRLISKAGTKHAKTAVDIEAEPGFDATPDYKNRLGASAFSTFRRVFRPYSAIEYALNGVDAGFERGDGRTDGPYDYAGNEEKKLGRGGILFHWINVKPSYMPDVARMSDEVSDTYHSVAKKFFSAQVNISADVGDLYEDVDGAVIIRMFRIRDRRGYYLLNEMRRVINDNVRKLSFIYTGIVLAVLVGGLFFLPTLREQIPQQQGVLGFVSAAFHHGLTGLSLCLAGLFLMWLTYYMEYVPNQRNNGREMRSFLSRYMSRLSDRYRDSLANARAVTVGDETDSAKLSAKAQKWHKIVLWISFRAFFMESFVRNVLYQIGRNCGYYVVLAPLALLFLVAFSLLVMADVFGFALAPLFAEPGIVFYIGFALLVLVYLYFLSRAMTPIDEMNQADWLGFDDLNVDQGMDQVVGKYAEDVGYWKGRLDR